MGSGKEKNEEKKGEEESKEEDWGEKYAPILMKVEIVPSSIKEVVERMARKYPALEVDMEEDIVLDDKSDETESEEVYSKREHPRVTYELVSGAVQKSKELHKGDKRIEKLKSSSTEKVRRSKLKSSEVDLQNVIWEKKTRGSASREKEREREKEKEREEREKEKEREKEEREKREKEKEEREKREKKRGSLPVPIRLSLKREEVVKGQEKDIPKILPTKTITITTPKISIPAPLSLGLSGTVSVKEKVPSNSYIDCFDDADDFLDNILATLPPKIQSEIFSCSIF